MEGVDSNERIPPVNSNRCGKYKKLGHNARTYPLDAKGKDGTHGETGMVELLSSFILHCCS